jgi:hypothetical protein
MEFNETGDKKAKAIDLNGDGKISAGEFTAYTIYQDGIKVCPSFAAPAPVIFDKSKVDGKVTSDEASIANDKLTKDPDAVKTALQGFYKDFGIADAQKNFKMPPKVQPAPTPKPSPQPNLQQLIMQLISMLLQRLMGRFGGQQKQFGF